MDKRKINRWKIAFFVCLVFLVTVMSLSAYLFIDQGVTITYMKDGYTKTESDLHDISMILNQTNLSKNEIKRTLIQYHQLDSLGIASDTISLERINLIFRNNKLVGITKQW